MIIADCIGITLLFVCTILVGSQSSIINENLIFGNLTHNDNNNNNNIILSLNSLNYKSDGDIAITCIEGQPGYDCCMKIKDDARKCINSKLRLPNKDETDKWSADDILKYSCCAITMMTDCIEISAKTTCSADDYDLYKKTIVEGIDKLNKGQCADHKIESGKYDFCLKTDPAPPTTPTVAPTSGSIGYINRQNLLTNVLFVITSIISIRKYFN
ncbi:uncharacterized protein LOC128958484 [Oppia nitens]|uniref:uncharacterized protein LOC128958484 n=1 Tax=Oppia nitens TaxID=1686743 RepID=UPI0023DAEF96|nr:uncharacterized protein LOC128958484 [Oppia nitens]